MTLEIAAMQKVFMETCLLCITTLAIVQKTQLMFLRTVVVAALMDEFAQLQVWTVNFMEMIQMACTTYS